MKEDEANSKTVAGSPPLIELRGIEKVYGDGGTARVQALQALDLAIRRGEFAAIVGPSGSGKSTLLHILGCLDRPTAGTYLLAGQDTSRLSDRELSAVRNRRIGFVFQAFQLLSDSTALENVMLPLLYRGVPAVPARQRAKEALAAVALEERLGHRPGQLSGGEQQRVAVARALVKRPDILLADEPTGNLDSANGEAILKLIEEAHRREVTVVLITHDPQVAARAGRVLRMKDGRLEKKC
ncbi:MAG: ABC transporter ATP-binding protein [Planctomycetes bacterium]|nr:ABC transporter ATP-binding protein [Planctomycetota bacterium]